MGNNCQNCWQAELSSQHHSQPPSKFHHESPFQNQLKSASPSAAFKPHLTTHTDKTGNLTPKVASNPPAMTLQQQQSLDRKSQKSEKKSQQSVVRKIGSHLSRESIKELIQKNSSLGLNSVKSEHKSASKSKSFAREQSSISNSKRNANSPSKSISKNSLKSFRLEGETSKNSSQIKSKLQSASSSEYSSSCRTDYLQSKNYTSGAFNYHDYIKSNCNNDQIGKQVSNKDNKPVSLMKKVKSKTESGDTLEQTPDKDGKGIEKREIKSPIPVEVKLTQEELRKQVQELKMKDAIVYQYPNGSTFQGQIQTNKGGEKIREGFGVQKWSDDSIYTGFWKGDMASGYGILVHKNGDTYEGYFKQDQQNGYGILKTKKGNRMEGTWLNDQLHGTGFEIIKGQYSYTGGYKHGLKSGYGSIEFQDGTKYEVRILFLL